MTLLEYWLGAILPPSFELMPVAHTAHDHSHQYTSASIACCTALIRHTLSRQPYTLCVSVRRLLTVWQAVL